MKLSKKIAKSIMPFDSGLKLPLRKKMALDYINSIRKNSKVVFYQPTYNPNNFELYRISDVTRKETDMRVDTISSQFDFNPINSYLDIGSQFGYFVFKLAESKKLIAHGIEMDKVLFVSDGSEVKVGAPYLDGAKVIATFKTTAEDAVVEGPKIYLTHFRRRKNSQRRMGHRQKYLQIVIDVIEA